MGFNSAFKGLSINATTVVLLYATNQYKLLYHSTSFTLSTLLFSSLFPLNLKAYSFQKFHMQQQSLKKKYFRPKRR
jgi:hypothetical protein